MPKLELQNVVIKKLEENKIQDIICVDVSRISSLADYVVIGSGRSGKHAEASMENLKIFLKQKYGTNGQINGSGNDGWIVFDLGNVIVHLFEPSVRKIYKLEELFTSRLKKISKKNVKKTIAKKVIAKKEPVVKKSVIKKQIIKKESTAKKSKISKKPVGKIKTVAKKSVIKKTK